MMRSLKQRLLTGFVVFVAAMIFPSTFKAQGRSYSSENVNYVLVLPSPQWRDKTAVERWENEGGRTTTARSEEGIK